MVELPTEIQKKFQDAGLTVIEPRTADRVGWSARFTICLGQEIEDGIATLNGPILWLWVEDGKWTVMRHHYVPGPGPGDFQHTHGSLTSACDDILGYYRDGSE